jgi:hypothetical protein
VKKVTALDAKARRAAKRVGLRAVKSRSWCGFRRKPATDSDAIRPPIPTEVGHPFRWKPATLLSPA